MKSEFPPSVCAPQSVESVVSFASETVRISQRLVQLSLPRLKQSNICLELGHPVESIWTVRTPTDKSSQCLLVPFVLKAPEQCRTQDQVVLELFQNSLGWNTSTQWEQFSLFDIKQSIKIFSSCLNQLSVINCRAVLTWWGVLSISCGIFQSLSSAKCEFDASSAYTPCQTFIGYMSLWSVVLHSGSYFDRWNI